MRIKRIEIIQSGADFMNYEREKREAAEAGENALYSLNQAKNLLKSAKMFGIWDILGGGGVISFFKHLKIRNAREVLQRAMRDLEILNDELDDVSPDLNIYIDDFLSFFDVFTDNWIADFMVQSRISDALERIDYAISEVNRALAQLG